MARPKEYEKRKGTNVRFPPELHERLQRAAEERALSVNWLVNRAVKDFLDRLLPLDQIRLTSDVRDPAPLLPDPPE